MLKARAKPSPKKTEYLEALKTRFAPTQVLPEAVRGLVHTAQLRATEHWLRSLIEMVKYGF